MAVTTRWRARWWRSAGMTAAVVASLGFVQAAEAAPTSVASGSVALPVVAPRTTATTVAAGPDWVVRGAGWGHGVGMSQYGAFEMAKAGYTAAQILNHYYTGTTYDAVTDNQLLSVNIAASAGTSTLTSAALVSGGGAFRLNLTGTTSSMTGAAGGQVSVTRSGASVVASCTTCSPVTTLTGAKISLVWDTLAQDKTLMRLGSSSYRDGTMYFTPASSGVNVVNAVRLHDEYLDYLRESPWSWHVEALKAQAAAARGYALSKYTNGIRSACGCHVYDTIADQVYGGYPSSGDLAYWPNWRSAVRATGVGTTGYVARSGGSIIQAFYASSSGGRTQNNEDVWGGTPLPYLRSVSDPWSVRPSNPNASWRTVVTGASLASAFGLSDVARLDLRDRTTGNGVDVATATSSAGATATIDGEVLRTRLGLKSTWLRHLGVRIGGASRYEVAANVAKRISGTAGTAILASGEAGAVFDASVSGPLSATLGGPLLLTAKASLPGPTLAELDRRKASLTQVVVVGGAGSVSDAVLTSLRQRYPAATIRRIGGVSRFDVARNVANEIASRRTVGSVVVASGYAIADALAASGPASALYNPILLTGPDTLPAETAAALQSTGAGTARVVGGSGSVSPSVEEQLRDEGLAVIRIGGADRYAVAANVATAFRPFFAVPSEIVMTSGSDAALADSLAAGSLRKLMVLTSPTALPEATRKVLQTTAVLDQVTVVGGTASVPNSLLARAQTS